jgi:alcohol dehydrogenase class IV
MAELTAPQLPTASEFRVPGIIRLGAETYRQVAGDVILFGIPRVLVVSDRNIIDLAPVKEILSDLALAGVETTTFVDIPGEPTTTQVDAGLVALRQAGAGLVLAIGGGSVLDTGKAIAAMASNPGRIADYMGRDKLVANPLPLVSVATTAGTGSEVTRYTIITDEATDVKMLITDWRLMPRVAVADPLLTLGMPRWVTASTGIDALTHAIEAYVGRRATPTSDLFALGAIRDIFDNLLSAWQTGDLAARAAMMRGSLYAGIAFSNASVALVHGMSRPIGAYFHVPHGLANAMLLPEIMAYSLTGAPERYRDVAVAMGVGSASDDAMASGQAAAAAVATLCRQIEIPTLREAGIDEARLRALAPRMAIDAVASGSPSNNPLVPNETEIASLYLRCL